MAPAPEPASPLLPADDPGLPRVSDPRYAQNAAPVLAAMGKALAELHLCEPPPDLAIRTDGEVADALHALDRGEPSPRPYERSRADTIRAALNNRPDPGRAVLTHGAPVVANARVDGDVVVFDEADCVGLDPPERDLAIALRSIAETFASEATLPFVEAYLAAGGAPPDSARLDWYALVAAFR